MKPGSLNSALRAGICLLPLLASPTAAHAQQASAQAADLVLTNGNILTVDEEFSTASAVAIDDGRFVAVGTDAEVEAFVGAETRSIDLQGKTVIPGLLDNHLHQLRGALNAPPMPSRSGRFWIRG